MQRDGQRDRMIEREKKRGESDAQDLMFIVFKK